MDTKNFNFYFKIILLLLIAGLLISNIVLISSLGNISDRIFDLQKVISISNGTSG